ncbi:T9SS type A sorting domain-containing protein [Flavobacteriaceae bacterium Ap0902]|nr:T9SS type A sorting domain-containing protein [Flavobacteriaceae bacterium Ap0902]
MKKFLLTATATFSICMGLAQETPKNVIFFIGDGFGTSAKTAARMALGQGTEGSKITSDENFQLLALDKLDYQGSLTTHSMNSWITDSGASASAYAAGVEGKLDNGNIAFNVETGESVETILEKAKKAGYAVGLVTTTRVTHATPATFATHVWSRGLETYIAAQYISSTQEEYEEIFNNPNSAIRPYNEERDWILPAPKVGVELDVLMGGGARFFLPQGYSQEVLDANGNPILTTSGNPVTLSGRRADNVNLVEVASNRGFVYANSRDALLNLDLSQFTPDNDNKFLGLFSSSHCSYEQDRQLYKSWEPSLPEMTEMAIKILKAKGGDKGFFLMVEAGRIDHLEHANNGGITVVNADGTDVYTIDSDKPAYLGGGDANYGANPDTPRHTDVFGSDYLIKEVLAFDYSINQARKLLDDDSKTLIFSTSDHECGGTAIVGLHDEADAQNNNTKIRTYALSPRQDNDLGQYVPNPSGVTRGDIDFGAMTNDGWFPNYETYTFQDRTEELWPKCDINGRRIVVAYASNPLTNGNGINVGNTPGNHTPMDVFVGAEDNMGGTFAGKINGVGQIDNTYLTAIMEAFLDVQHMSTVEEKVVEDTVGEMKIFPNPATDYAMIQLQLEDNSKVEVSIYNESGQLVKNLNTTSFAKVHSLNVNTSDLNKGLYIVSAKTNQGSLSQKLLVK